MYSTKHSPVTSIRQPCHVYTAAFVPLKVYGCLIASSVPNISAVPESSYRKGKQDGYLEFGPSECACVP